MTNNFEKIVNYLIDKHHFNTLDVSKDLDIQHEQVLEVIKLIQSIGDYLMLTERCLENWNLTQLGKSLMEHCVKQGDHNNSNNLIKNKLKQDIDMEMYFNLNIIQNGGKLDDNEKLLLYEFKKYIEKSTVKCIEGEVLKDESLSDLNIEYSISENMLKEDRWKTAKILPYNFDGMGQKIQVGNLHYLTEIINNVRQILLEIGFTEENCEDFIENPFLTNNMMLITNPDVENSYIVNTKLKNNILNEVSPKIKNIKKTNNGTTDINKLKPVIRNNLNNNLSKLLNKAAVDSKYPLNKFVIGKVLFSGKTDFLHLAEFHVLKILVLDTQLNFSNIIGLLDVIFKKLNIENIEYKPAYSPLSVPTLETICYHYGMDQWIRIGKSGIIRQEILKSMNLQNNLVGLVLTINLERVAMIKKDAVDIREVL
uniref:tRNA-synt_2d domain-containing protein n=1 Tax=Rhodnius prolixus TaxID=13249 RepID=T1I9X5_RHOPR